MVILSICSFYLAQIGFHLFVISMLDKQIFNYRVANLSNDNKCGITAAPKHDVPDYWQCNEIKQMFVQI